MGITVKVLIRDRVGKDFMVTEVKRIQEMAESDTYRLSKECEKIIQEIIMNKTQLPTGRLASFFIAEKILNGWGVGDIATLDKEVPYWNHLDKGSEGIGANWSHYLPRGFWVNGRWVESSNGFVGIKPKTPIQAINYIAETLAKMEISTPIILKKG